MTAPRLSVCLLVYNEARYLAETLDSIARQTFGDFEVHIFDNASNDATPEICARYLADPRFRHFRNAANIGMVANFNRCHAAARGEYVAILSGNDVLDPAYFEKLIALADTDPAIGLVTSRIRVILESSEAMPQALWVQPAYFETDPEDPVAAGIAILTHWRFGHYVFGIYRRAVLDRLQPMRPLHGADACFVFELALYARVRVHADVLFGLRRHGSAQVQKVVNSFSEDLLFDVAPNGVFTHFDLVTPYIDQTWNFLETTSFARIPNVAKFRLSNAILSLQRARWVKEIGEEVAVLKAKAPQTLQFLRARPDAAAHRGLAHRLALRLSRATLVAPPDEALCQLAEEAARLLRPTWPGVTEAP